MVTRVSWGFLKKTLINSNACKDKMKATAVAIVCLCVLGSQYVTSTPVMPALSLKHFSPTDVCLFMCNICFDDMGPEMMECANNLCLANQNDMSFGLIRLGRICKNFNRLEDLLFGNETN